jgi:hypothetical protein
MAKNVEKLPISTWQRIQNKRGKWSASCIVSDRWLQFAPEIVGSMQIGTAVAVNVMTSVSGSDRKICELTLTLEDLRRVLKQYEESAGSS